MNDLNISAFMADDNLMEMLEQVKISDDIFDVINLVENQHSDMLAWCLNPNEGHSQGDALIKDFLMSAHGESFDCTYANKKFFAEWTPSKIRTSSFGTAFVSREFSIKLDSDGAKGRLDLFLIDPANKIIVAIENKAGAKLTGEQLDDYYAQINTVFGTRPIFKDFQFAFVVIDRKLDFYPEDHIIDLGTRWVLLNYQWLESAAKRAKHHLARNNQAAQLLMAYCQKQTHWEKPSEKRLSELASDLVSEHEPVISALWNIKFEKIAEWTPSLLKGELGSLRLFYQQSKQLCNVLFEARGIGSVASSLRQKMLPKTPYEIVKTRVWLGFATQTMSDLIDQENENSNWPVYVAVQRESTSNSSESKFNVTFVWRRDNFAANFDAEKLRNVLAKDFRALDKFTSSSRRRVVVKSQVSSSVAAENAYLIAIKIDQAIREVRDSSL